MVSHFSQRSSSLQVVRKKHFWKGLASLMVSLTVRKAFFNVSKASALQSQQSADM